VRIRQRHDICIVFGLPSTRDPSMSQPLFDQIPGWLILIGTIVLFATMTELGVRLARWRRRTDDDKKTQAGVLLGALLALLGLSLAFSFSIAESRFVERRQLVLEEANAIGTTYLRASLLPPPHRANAEELLREYVEMRIVESPGQLTGAIERSEALHQELWAEAVAASEAKPDPITSLFVQSLNQVIDLHEERLTVALHQRLPGVILLTLYLVALLAMGTLGYSMGLSRTRTILPSLAVIAAVAIVLLLIIDLDRPFQRVFEVDQAAIEDVRETISRNH
jgi:hypothetical protein